MRLALSCIVMALALSACGGGHSASPLPAAVSAGGGGGDDAVSPASPARGDDWPTFARDVQRQSYESLPTGITQSTVSTLQLRWVYPAYGVRPKAGIDASPIVVNGVVYIADESGVVNAFDALTGKPKWAAPYVIPDSTITKMTPAVIDGKLFVASYQNNAPSDTNYYFAAVDPNNGHQLWITKLPGAVHGSPVAVHGILYVPVSVGDEPYCREGGIYALDENTGLPAGTNWLTDPPGSSPDGGGVWSSITYDGSQMFYGTGNTCVRTPADANSIVALTPGAAAANWFYTTASPLLDDDIGGTVLRIGHSAFAVGKNGWFYHLNALNGQLIWKTFLGAPDGAGAFATPSYYGSGPNGTLIVGGGYIRNPDTCNCVAGGRLFGLYANGSVRWEDDTQQPVFGYVAVTPDLAFTTLDKNVDALDPLTGKVLWSYPSIGYFYASPVIVPSGLFVADESGRVYAFGLPATSGGAKTAAAPVGVPGRAQILDLQRRENWQIHRKPKVCRVRAQPNA